ncbi:hypothetical protein F4561_003080 [Lipingzhangella halophila]|uniref:Sulfotransferase family protein n=1 Tax=Lipingzhangella halophila TaxID=1783352 RepID=A0A7W7RHV5_9ACTN|nr:hypothetical protein [Lipingzhangella halophila]MBB4932260.1 hypothetical protein [Lipingzhangella halophila]
MSGVAPLPSNVRLLHIGPHKSGTTAVQGAFHLARERLAGHGITYIGKGLHPVRPVQAITGRGPMLGEPAASTRDWDNLVAEVAATGDQRAVISSEFFAEADDAVARRVVSDLGDQVHVVVTLRPLGKVLAAQWQQYVQNGLRDSFEEWLDIMFNRPHERPNSTFWRRHQQGEIVTRWANAVGPENLTVICVDDSDPRMLMRTFEGLLDLPEKFLVPDDSTANRSLTHAEAELVRGFNQQFKAGSWPTGLYASHIRRGAVKRMKVAYKPTQHDRAIRTPEWALERAAKLGSEGAETITALGVHVIGDLELLSEYPSGRAGTPDPDVALAPQAAAEAVMGVVAASAKEAKAKAKPGKSAHDRTLREVTARELARELFARGLRKARRARKRVLKSQKSASS